MSNSVESEFKEISEKNTWINVFMNIRETSETYAREKNLTVEESKKAQNRKLNRYRDVNPYDYSRIVLQKGIGGSDYINANIVKMERAKRQYILCQGPLEITVGHFWLMVWEQQSTAILMLNKIIEKKQVKCHLYWPEKLGEKLELADAGLSIEYVNCENYRNFSKRVFKLTDIESSKSRDVIQFHYTTWPDFGVPSSPIAFLQFLKQVRDSGALDENVGPPVIHCSAGIGRSGTFCLVDCCLVLIDKEGENRVSVQDVLLELRKYRMGLIQTFDQLKFSYEAIIEGMKRMNNDTFNELDNLEIATNDNEENEADEPAPPPLPRRLTSLTNNNSNGNDTEQINNVVNREMSHISRPLPPAPNKLLEIDETISDPTDEDTSDDEDELESDPEKDSESEISEKETSEEEEEMMVPKAKSGDGFDANASLPPIPNGTFDINSDKQMSSSEGEMSPKSNTSGTNQELRHRARVEKNAAMQDKIREIKRKQKEVEDKKLSSPKKRRHQLEEK